MKVAVIGCGLRTPLLLYGLTQPGLGVSRVTLYDHAPHRAQLMAALGKAAAPDSSLEIIACDDAEEAVEDGSFVIHSIRAGGMEGRAKDERIAVDYGFAGQETTGPAGFAMALRTVPAALHYAELVARKAPRAWMINFTNPAGLITQAMAAHANPRVVGICDTPAELFFRISLALGEPLENIKCDYFGLNHLGWVRQVQRSGEDVTAVLLQDDDRLNRLYPAPLFPPALIRSLGMIPTEYLFFYYRHRLALQNQLAVGATRGEELHRLNDRLSFRMESAFHRGDIRKALHLYRDYLNRRNASYFKLEGSGLSALDQADVDWDPFQGETGYHRIAVDAIQALSGEQPSRMVLNVKNQGAIPDLAPEDVVEIPCLVDRSGPRPIPAGPLPDTVRGLTIAVKNYERLTIKAAIRRDIPLAALALFTNPIVADWDAAWGLAHAYSGSLKKP
ncbi:MAG TPA: hypothetical protein VM120_05570 [Bryobacteraceae bacterium]|nr:hypothetical protein [Bryobacteraceae bacterium]